MCVDRAENSQATSTKLPARALAKPLPDGTLRYLEEEEGHKRHPHKFREGTEEGARLRGERARCPLQSSHSLDRHALDGGIYGNSIGPVRNTFANPHDLSS